VFSDAVPHFPHALEKEEIERKGWELKFPKISF
jgi:hypothetical protein